MRLKGKVGTGQAAGIVDTLSGSLYHERAKSHGGLSGGQVSPSLLRDDVAHVAVRLSHERVNELLKKKMQKRK